MTVGPSLGLVLSALPSNSLAKVKKPASASAKRPSTSAGTAFAIDRVIFSPLGGALRRWAGGSNDADEKCYARTNCGRHESQCVNMHILVARAKSIPVFC